MISCANRTETEQFVALIVHVVKHFLPSAGDSTEEKGGIDMHSTYTGMPRQTRLVGTHTRVGLTDPAVIDAYVERRIQDPSLLSGRSEPSYADFFTVPAA
jgi:hypothetical protein